MQYKVKCGTGTIVGNLLRQIALTQLDAVNVVAYSVGQLSTVIATNNNNVLEDMIEFGNNLSSYVYEFDNNSNFKRLTLDVESVLTIEDITRAGIIVHNPDNLNGELLHLLNGATSVTLIFRKNNNLSLADDNRSFLESKGIDLTNMAVINSRFRGIKNFRFEVLPCDQEFEYLNVYVESMADKSEKELLELIWDKLKEVLDVIPN